MNTSTNINSKIILTGDRPTGMLHLGHYVGSLSLRIGLQDGIRKISQNSESDISQNSESDQSSCQSSCQSPCQSPYQSSDQTSNAQQDSLYIIIADMQAMTDYFDRPKIVGKNILQLVEDYIAVGLDPNLACIFVQSAIPEIAMISMYYMNLVTYNRVIRNPTVKTELATKNFADNITCGFLCYPISQAADITAFNGNIIPVGEDQIPMIEQTNEIVKKFNSQYQCNILQECSALISNFPKLLGIDGKAKCSKSLNNCIFLSDPSETVRLKVFSMYTDPLHIRASDPGNIEGNVVFHYLDAFHPNKDEVEDLKLEYRRGGLGDFVLKEKLYLTIEEFLAPIRERRSKIDKKLLPEILQNGNAKARRVAAHTLQKIKDVLGVGWI